MKNHTNHFFISLFKQFLMFCGIVFCICSVQGWRSEAKAETGKASPAAGQVVKKDLISDRVFDPDSELKRLNKLIELGMKNADVFYNLGWAHEYKGDLQRAEKDYTRAIEIDKSHVDAYYNRGIIYIRTKRYEKAVTDFSTAIKLKPDLVDAFCNRGNAYFLLGKTALTIEDYNAALRIAPKDPDLYYNRAVIYIAKGERRQAMEDFETAAGLGHDLAREYLDSAR
ncbi:tetratricopeptide repeat protein [Thermodesulfobacteriota bacterium]